jgi:prepilin-type N-terminal cleavage/methylation domain-containing protein
MRRAFSMIELCITIVLLGIVFAAIPGLLYRSVESDAASLEGEALYHAAAKMQEIIAQPHNSMLNKERYRNLPLVIDYYAYGWVTNAPSNRICISGGGIETQGLALLKSVAPTLKRDALCADNGNVGDLDPIPATPTSPQSAINHYNGWSQTNFARGYKLEVTVTPMDDPRASNTIDTPPAPSDWSGFPVAASAHVPTDLLVITVRAAYNESDETIGVLRYVASNIGKR